VVPYFELIKRGLSMKILLVYPRYPDTFWSFRHALKFISKKAAFPPLGLLTIAAMLPGEWEKRLVDLNVRELEDEDIRWADYVFISAMSVQKRVGGRSRRALQPARQESRSGRATFHLLTRRDCGGRPLCTQ